MGSGMKKVTTEIDAMNVLDATLMALGEAGARDRVLAWAWAKFSSQPMPRHAKGSEEHEEAAASTKPRKRSGAGRVAKKIGGSQAKVRSKAKAKLSLAKDLNLQPANKLSFDKFVGEKNPSTKHEQCVVAVYYLKHRLSLAAVTPNHVYTCFKHAHWRMPANLVNLLRWTASQRGWLDTSKSDSIELTPAGENLVEHDLPTKAKKTP